MPETLSPETVRSLGDLWRSVAGLPAGAEIAVREEPHCPDPGCPLRRTVLEWREAAGAPRRAVVVKPAAYVRRADLERALRQPGGSAG